MLQFFNIISGNKDTMASYHGTITEFSGIAGDWEAYMEQLKSYFVANDITVVQLMNRRVNVIGVEGSIILTSVCTESVCHSHKKGHLPKKWHQRNKSGIRKSPHSRSTHHIGTESTDTDKEAEDDVYTMFTISSSKQGPI